MSGLSHKSHGELNNLVKNIVISEKQQNPIVSRALQYAKGTLSPIIKKNLKLDPKKGLAKGLLDKALQKGVSALSQAGRGGYEVGKETVYGAGRQLKGLATFTLPRLALPSAVGAAAADLTAPSRGGKSKILDFLKPKYEETYQEGEVLTEEVIQENTSVLVYAIGDYLVENNFASDSEKAIKIMENMSDEWAEEIIVSYLQIEENVDG